jgi:hypothetical protein
MRPWITTAGLALALAAGLAGCATPPGAFHQDFLQGRRLFTAYNLWVEQPDEIFDINYKRGMILPAGTAVSAVGLQDHPRFKRIHFTLAADGRQFIIHWNSRYHPGRTLQDFADALFGPGDFAALTEGFSAEEIAAVKGGRVVRGMGKPAVLAAYGPPPEHATFSLESSVWIYWANRLVTQSVRFDAAGRVLEVH